MQTKHERDNQNHRGGVRDPENDERLKDNREAGRTKGTTSGSEAHAHGHEPTGRGGEGGSPNQSGRSEAGHSGGREASGQRDDHSHAQSHGGSGGHRSDQERDRRPDTQSHAGSSQERGHRADQRRDEHAEEADLKRREYTGDDGQVHHHTRTYMDQHGGKK